MKATRLFHKVVLGLIVSVFFNIALTCFLIYSMRQVGVRIISSSAFTPSPHPQACSQNLESALAVAKKRSFHELLEQLGDQSAVSDGYRQCDLALAVLVQDHFFDLHRFYKPTDIRTFHDAVLFPSIPDKDFAHIVSFAQTERFPVTAEGLFYALQKNPHDEHLRAAFFRTEEYIVASTLLGRAYDEMSKPIDAANIQALLLQGTWKHLAALKQQQQEAQDFSREKRFLFLLSYVPIAPKQASLLLASYEPELTSTRLTDKALQDLLRHLDQTEVGKAMAKRLVSRPRSQELLALCTQIVGSDGTEAVQPVPTTPRKNQAQLYVVQEGDSLWKISRKFHVDLERLREENKLKSDALQPGATLRIPAKGT